MAVSIQDDAGVQNALRKKYASPTIAEQNIFDLKCDALLAHIQDTAENNNGGAGFILQMSARGSAQGPNRKFSLAGQGKPAFRQITLGTKDIEERFGWTRNAMMDAMASGGSKGGFNLAKKHIDMSLRLIKQNIGQLLESDGFGTLAYVAVVDSVGATSVFTPGDGAGAANANKSRQNRFYVGQVLVFSAAAMTGEIRSSAASEATIYKHPVTAIDRATGKITVTGNLTTSGVVAGDAVSTEGYRAFDASASGATVFYGLDAWAPTTAIGAGDPLGRNGKPDLQPYIMDVSGLSITDALAEIDQMAFDLGIDQGFKMFVPSHVTKALQQGVMKNQIVDRQVTRKRADGSTYNIGYAAFVYQGMRGAWELIPSAHTTVARLFDPSIFRLAYSGEGIVQVMQRDGRMYRVETAGVTDASGALQSGDTGEAFSRLALLCDRPGDIIVAKGLKE